MRAIDLLISSIIMVLVTACSSSPQSSNTGARFNAALHQEILAMVGEDQRAREGFGPNMFEARLAELQRVDARHQARMNQIISRYGWPGRSLVGDDGANAAWLLVQHEDTAMMTKCLPMMERAVAAGEADPRDFVFLLDRVRLRQGKPQIYGTQFQITRDGRLVCDPMDDPEHVDDRRRSVGLPSMAEYEQQLRQTYRLPAQ